MSEERDRDGLEGRVRELEATVESLTSELVDATERIRQLEAELDAESSGDATADQTPDSWVPAAEDVTDDAVDSDEQSEGAEEHDEDSATRDSDEIIVA